MKIAKIFIKGSREPLEASQELGKRADQIKKGEGEFAGLSNKDVVSVGDIWTGEKGDLRMVVFETIKGKGESVLEYTPNELYKFEEELKPYFIQKGDDQFNKWVEKFMIEVMDLKSKLLWSDITRERLLGIRNKYDISGGDISEEKKEQIKINILVLVNERIEGTLNGKGELQYLANNEAVNLGKNEKDFTIIQWADGRIPYEQFIGKLTQYKKWKARKEYATAKQMEGLEELAQEMTIENSDNDF